MGNYSPPPEYLKVTTNTRKEKVLTKESRDDGVGGQAGASVEADGVQEGPAALLLELLEQLLDLVLHVLRVLDLRGGLVSRGGASCRPPVLGEAPSWAEPGVDGEGPLTPHRTPRAL